MAIDFPGSPSTGQRHSHNNTTWEWDGSSWNRITIDLSTTDATTVVGLAVTQFVRRDDDNIITGVTTFIGNGYTGVGNTVLIVEGDARVTGVLSVGQGSVSINERDIYAVGVVTGANFKTGTTNVHNVGVEAAGINVLGADTPIGTGATVYNSGLIVSKSGAEYQGVVTATDNLNIVTDNKKLQVGAGQDLTLYHDGNNSIIKNVTGNLYLNANNTQAGILLVGSTGAVTLSHGGNLKFETEATGAKVTGDLNVTGHIDVADNVRLKLGTHDDINIYHDGTNSFFENTGGHLTIQNDVAGGNLYLKGKSGEHSIICNRDGAVEIYHDNAKKLESTSGGINVTGKAIIDAIDVTELSNGATTNGIFLNAGDTGAGNRPYLDIKGAGSSALSAKAIKIFYNNGSNESFFVDYEGNISGRDINGTGDLTLTSTDAGSAAGPEFKLYRNSASPADADYIGQLKFAGESDTGVERNYAKITGKILDASNGTEDGILEFAHIKAGSQTITGRWRSDSLQLLNGTSLTVAGTSEFTGDATFNGNVSIGKTLTYEDVKNIDSVGVVTARSGFEVTSGTFKANSQVGAAGSVLSTTGSGIHWVSPLTGPQGAQGHQGVQGAQGHQGHQGVQGAQGHQGVQGAQGRQGAAGVAGAQGAQGATGSSGGTGAQGHQGVQGATGSGGSTGSTGAQGHQGVQGATGSGGSTGSTGAQGHQGVQGAVGVSVSNNGDNRVITGGSGTNLNGESTLTYDGTTFTVHGMQIQDAGRTNNLKFKGGTGTDVGLTLYNSSNTWVAQMYGTSSGYYGFLNANWNSWDIKKQVNGQMTLRIGSTDQTVWHSGNFPFDTYLNQGVKSTSSPTFVNVYANDWLRNNNSGEGLYNETSQGHFYQAGDNYWHLNGKSSVTNGALILYGGHNSSQGHATGRKGYLYWDSSGFGLLDSTGSWAFRTDGTNTHMARGHVNVSNNVICGNWYYNNTSGEGLYSSATTQHWYSDSDDYWNLGGGTGANGIIFRDEHGGTIRGYCYANNSNQIGFLNSGGSWAFAVNGSTNVITYLDFIPSTGGSKDLGSSSNRWRTIYVNDLELSNESKKDEGGNDVDGTWGNWTLQEGEGDIFMINNRNGKKYKIALQEVS